MDPRCYVEARQGEVIDRMLSIPSGENIEEVWSYVETGINRIMLEPSYGIDTQTIVGLYTAVYNFCTSQEPGAGDGASPSSDLEPGGKLYDRLTNWLREYIQELRQRSESLSGEDLRQFYFGELAHYAKAARYIHHVFRYLDRHWIKRKTDEGHDISRVYKLHLKEWQDGLQNVYCGVMKTSDKPERELELNAPNHIRSEAIIESFNTMQLKDDDFPMFLTDCEGHEDLSRLRKELGLTTSLLFQVNPKPHGPIDRENPHGNMIALVKLVTNDSALVEVERQAAECSAFIRLILEEIGDELTEEELIPLPQVNEVTLRKVLEWCEHHKEDMAVTKTSLAEEWDAKFMTVDQDMLFGIILAANYLEIPPLLTLGCATVANMIKGKSPDEIRKTFDITNDFTPEEEEQIRKENGWKEGHWP